jgi:hypothetical protein
MNGLSDSLTIGLVLALVFGALFFYLYTRLTQAEKRVSLTENILLDLKMATENTLMSIGSAQYYGLVGSANQMDEHDLRVEPISAPEPVDSNDIDQVPEEEFYKSVLQQAETASASSTAGVEPIVPVSSLDVNYESMTTKELKAMAKQRGIPVASSAHKREIVDALKRGGTAQPVAGSLGGPNQPEGFPVDSITEENRTAHQE